MSARGGVACLLALAGIAGCGAATPPDHGLPPVLLVHGLGDSGDRTWPEFRRALLRAGWPREYVAAPDIVPADTGNIAAARKLSRVVDSLLAATQRAAQEAGRIDPPRRIAIVGHSMGALSARLAARERPEQVAFVITLAGANHGTDAFCRDSAQGPDDLCPAFARSDLESEVQVLLNGVASSPADETPWSASPDPAGTPRVLPSAGRSIAYLAFHAEREDWIRPKEAVRLAGATPLPAPLPAWLSELEPGNYLVRGTDHDAIAHDRRVIDLLLQVLRGQAPGVER